MTDRDKPRGALAALGDVIGPRLRAAPHYRPGQLAAWGLDRAARVVEAGSPVGLHRLASALTAGVRADRSALAAWGRRPGCRVLSPRFDPERHGDPRLGEYCFQGVRRRFPARIDWSPADASALWTYHLHYLDGPTALVVHDPGEANQRLFAALLEDHWSRTRPGRGVGWQPFPVAERLQNLLRTWALLEASGGLSPTLGPLLARQARAHAAYLAARLEHHLLANHLLKELCALACAAEVLLPRARGAVLAALLRQVEAQFGAGGGHEERSLRYHLDALRDLAEVASCLGDGTPPELLRAIRKGLRFAAALEHPDGDVPLFNDAELGTQPSRAELSELIGDTSREAEPPTSHGVAPRGSLATGGPPRARPRLDRFDEEGYVAARRGDAFLVVDCGPVSVDHQPAHAHCDILSFELSLGASRVVSNRGTLAYGRGEARDVGRRTAAHNTVQVGDREQVELFSGFRVGRRGRPRLLLAEESDGVTRIAGEFRWYGGAVHHRLFELRDRALMIEDRVTFHEEPEPVVARLHLPGAELVEALGHPPAERRDASGGERPNPAVIGPAPPSLRRTLRTPSGPITIQAEGAELGFEVSSWFPRLGETEPALLVTVRPTGAPGRPFRVTLARAVPERGSDGP